MKKIYLFQIIGIVILVLLSGNVAQAASFSDVPGSHLNSDAIQYVKDNGIVSGYPDGTFGPDKTINRAEFTKIIIGAQFGADVIENCLAENTQAGWTYVFFPDVKMGDWFAKYVCVAKMHDIIKGYPDGTFGPAKDINFAEAAKIIVNTFGYAVATDEVWYKPFVEKLGEKKSIPTTITGFAKNITRGEMAEMVYRLKANVTAKESLSYETIATAVSDWLTYRNDIYGFEFQYPKGIATETEGLNNKYVRIDNLNNPLDDKPRMLSSGEFYLEIFIFDHKLSQKFSSSCTNADDPMVIDYEKVVLGTEYGYRGDGIMGGDSGGKRFAMCSEQTDADFYIVGTENDEDGKIINKIFDTFKFIDTGTTATYKNDEYGYSVSYPNDWHYKETGGIYFLQAVGFNPNGTSDEDSKAKVAVLSVDIQEYLDSIDSNSNLKIVQEISGFEISGLPGTKFVYQNLITGDQFSIYTLAFEERNYMITVDPSIEDALIGSFILLK